VVLHGFGIYGQQETICLFTKENAENPTDVIFSICHLLDDWNVLQKEKVSRNMQRVSDCGRSQ
jgi:hypothetical protein